MIDAVIVDDQEIVREGLKMILSLHEEIHVIGEAVNGEDLLLLLQNTVPDVILMDVRMPIMDGIEATRRVKKSYPEIKVIILTTFQEDEYIFNGMKNGADGYVFKDAGSSAIMDSIYAAYDGNVLLNSLVAKKVMGALGSVQGKIKMGTADLREILTIREVEVCNQVMLGKSNREIGATLFVTEGTVKNYISHILDKLNLNSRAELLVYLSGRMKQPTCADRTHK